jgi:hypothetical protein
MSVPRRKPLSIRIGAEIRARLSARTSSGDTAASSWRPPWLERITPSAPAETHRSASSGRMMPFTNNLRGQSLRSPLKSSQLMLESICRLI